MRATPAENIRGESMLGAQVPASSKRDRCAQALKKVFRDYRRAPDNDHEALSRGMEASATRRRPLPSGRGIGRWLCRANCSPAAAVKGDEMRTVAGAVGDHERGGQEPLHAGRKPDADAAMRAAGQPGAADTGGACGIDDEVTSDHAGAADNQSRLVSRRISDRDYPDGGDGADFVRTEQYGSRRECRRTRRRRRRRCRRWRR